MKNTTMEINKASTKNLIKSVASNIMTAVLVTDKVVTTQDIKGIITKTTKAGLIILNRTVEQGATTIANNFNRPDSIKKVMITTVNKTIWMMASKKSFKHLTSNM